MIVTHDSGPLMIHQSKNLAPPDSLLGSFRLRPFRITLQDNLECWGGRWGLNPRPPESQSGALPTELRPPLNTFHQRMARPEGLEPSTLGLEGRCSIQLSYGRLLTLHPRRYQLPGNLVGVERFELPTSCSQSRRATRLRYTPISNKANIAFTSHCYNEKRGRSERGAFY